jgi:superfamily II DNA or RNA helicase
MTIHLREYQSEAREAFSRSEARAKLGVMPTGTGKTVTMSLIAGEVLKRGERVLAIAHRQELVFQIARTMEKVHGITPAIEMGERRADSSPLSLYNRSQIVVASKDSLRHRLRHYKPDRFGLLITDEAHHAVAKTYRSIESHFLANDGCEHHGWTATPDRADEVALGEIYDEPTFEYTVLQAVRDDGWLVPIRQRFVACEHLDFSKVKTRGGDLNEKELSEILTEESEVHEMVAPLVEVVGDRRCIVFCVDTKHAALVAEVINRYGKGQAVIVTGKTDADTRAAIFQDFSRGRSQYLVNVGIATEGWDDPAEDGKGVQVVAIMRPTKSRALYAQMIGRGFRPLPGTVDGLPDASSRHEAIAKSAKPYVEVLDFVGNAGEHKLISAIDIMAGRKVPPDVVKAATEKVEQAADAQNVIDEITKAVQEMRVERERKRRAIVQARAEGVVLRDVDPFDALAVAPKVVPGWVRGSDDAASAAQRRVLNRMGFAIPAGLTKIHASQLIDEAKRQSVPMAPKPPKASPSERPHSLWEGPLPSDAQLHAAGGLGIDLRRVRNRKQLGVMIGKMRGKVGSS